MAAEVATEVEKQTGAVIVIKAGDMQRVLETRMCAHLEAFSDLRVSLA